MSEYAYALMCLNLPEWLLFYISPLQSLPSWHGCISDAYLRRFTQCLRDNSKRADLQISETSPRRLIKGVSSEMSLRSLRFTQGRL